MDLDNESLNSPDRNIRKEYLSKISQSHEIPIEKKIDTIKIALLDSHDSIRNLAIEYLSNIYENENKINFIEIVTEVLRKESIWSVKYLILKKISKYSLDVSNYKDLILKMTFEIKPQIRIASAEVLMLFPPEKQSDEILNRLMELHKDKDESVRKAIENVLAESKNPKIKKFIADYQQKVQEKEKKNKDVLGMFEGI